MKTAKVRRNIITCCTSNLNTLTNFPMGVLYILTQTCIINEKTKFKLQSCFLDVKNKNSKYTTLLSPLCCNELGKELEVFQKFAI